MPPPDAAKRASPSGAGKAGRLHQRRPGWRPAPRTSLRERSRCSPAASPSPTSRGPRRSACSRRHGCRCRTPGKVSVEGESLVPALPGVAHQCRGVRLRPGGVGVPQEARGARRGRQGERPPPSAPGHHRTSARTRRQFRRRAGASTPPPPPPETGARTADTTRAAPQTARRQRARGPEKRDAGPSRRKTAGGRTSPGAPGSVRLPGKTAAASVMSPHPLK